MLTIVNAYYRNAGMLAEHYRRFSALPQFIRERIEYIVVDDGTTWTRDSEPVWQPVAPDLSMRTQGFYIDSPKIPWNYACARNIGVKHASNPYVLVTDIDHAVPETTLFWLLNFLSGGVESDGKTLKFPQSNSPCVYKFSHRIKAATGERYKKHPDTILCTKHFWTDVLGYHDEKYRGGYGGDGEHWERIKSLATVLELDLPLILFGREAIPDASTQPDAFAAEGANRKDMRHKATVAKDAPKLTFGSSYHRVW